MSVEKVYQEIKELKIQGARKIALAAVDALIDNYKNPKNAKKDIDLLFSARPTEPMMRNYLMEAYHCLENGMERKEVKEKIKKNMEENINKIKKYGVNLIPEGATILTHCHSSTVVGILTNAINKKIKVYCTETRPKWQGRITAKELVKNNVDTINIVDSCVRSVIKDVDMVIVGGDAISARGNLINKVGTGAIAIIAKEFKVPFYSAVEMAKFSFETIYGVSETIEERDWKEVVGDDEELTQYVEKGKLNVRNPAFDVTLAEYISGYICEMGVLKPDNFVSEAKKMFGD